MSWNHGVPTIFGKDCSTLVLLVLIPTNLKNKMERLAGYEAEFKHLYSLLGIR